jgi:hypothetical protein
MGGIEYLSYSIVKHTQLVTLRMQDASLLVIKLADNGGMKKKKTQTSIVLNNFCY